MRCLIFGVVAMAFGIFMWMWAIQDASLLVAGNGWTHTGDWQGWAGDVLIAAGIALCIVAWVRSRRSRRN